MVTVPARTARVQRPEARIVARLLDASEVHRLLVVCIDQRADRAIAQRLASAGCLPGEVEGHNRYLPLDNIAGYYLWAISPGSFAL